MAFARKASSSAMGRDASSRLGSKLPSAAEATFTVLSMKLEQSHGWDQVAGIEPTGGVSNYFGGTGPNTSITGIPHYAKLRATKVYDGVDVAFYGSGPHLEYDFVVEPNTDPNYIRLAFDGLRELHVDQPTGDLVLTASDGSHVRQLRPQIYQESAGRRVQVAGDYRIIGPRSVTFSVADYDHSKPLIIDPRLDATETSARFLGGSAADFANAIAVDPVGNSFITGYTISPDFQTTTSASPQGGDAFIAKIAPDGTLLKSVLLRGSSFDSGNAIALDDSGVYVAGQTFSPDFFHTKVFGSIGTLGGTFVTKLDFDLGAIIYSTRVSGTNIESANAIALDGSSHIAYVTGQTTSVDFPLDYTLPPGGKPLYVKPGFAGGDAFIYELAPDGSLVYSTYLGGSGFDAGYGIAVDHAGGIWATGETCSSDFPHQFASDTKAANCVGYLMRWSAQFASLSFSRYYAIGRAITADHYDTNNYAYVTGNTDDDRMFAAIVAPSGNNVHETSIRSVGTEGHSIAINPAGQVYIGGNTSDGNFPGAFPAPALPPNLAYTYGFISRFSADLSTLDYSEIAGDAVNGIAVSGTAPWATPTLIYTAGAISRTTPESKSGVQPKRPGRLSRAVDRRSASDAAIALCSLTELLEAGRTHQYPNGTSRIRRNRSRLVERPMDIRAADTHSRRSPQHPGVLDP
ncbi:MAG: SBBP repeat-containing protein [Acidobacteriaceae bacterium]|nr:SBBP repeat-containing protein [Acidobacteriaceae bacterium]